ncbi:MULTISPECIES: ComEC/Rec2 family competence protein [Microbacterium]|uniref:ComEC/Rec2 family competence protein n=1 Tax=Microbacterium TaxID=33882 RepID=UPI001F0FC55B|nr:MULTISPECIES: ComEC/Rec2 family competence protein [Microbacterium]
MNARRGARVVPVAATAWAAAAFAVLAPPWAGWAAVALCAGAATVISGMLVTTRPRAGWGVVAVCLAVGGAVCAHVGVVEPSRAEARSVAEPGRAVVVEAVVTGRLDPSSSGDVWFDATAHTIRAGAEAVSSAVVVRVGVRAADAASLAGVDLGARVRVPGVPLPPEAGEREVAVIRASAPVEVVHPPAGILAPLAQLRRGLADAAARLPPPGAALIPGLALGDTAAVDATLEESMRSAALTHLTAVSGANCAIVVGLAFGIAALCGARRGVRAAAGLGALALFVLLVTPEPSVVRAGAMASIAMLAMALGRAGSGLAVLSVAVAVLLMLDPWLALTWGFALSATATASLLVLAGPLAAVLGRWMPRMLALAIAVPLAAQLACGPLLIVLDPHVALLGVPANMLAGPAAPLATVTGLLACLAAPLPVVRDGLVAIAWVPAAWIAGIAETVAALPAQRLPWLEGVPGAVALGIVCAALIAALLMPAGMRGRRMLRGASIAVLTATAGWGAAQAALVSVTAPWTVPAAWQIAMCDVGQGDAVLVRSESSVALIDTGPAPDLLQQCLDRFGIDRLDLLVLTHFDADHAGGVEAVMGRVARVWHGPPDTDGARALARLEAAGAEHHQALAGDAVPLGAATVRALWPAASVREAGNDASIAIDVRGGGLPATVLLGDLSAEPQARMRASASSQDYAVVKVAHHGSADQDPALYDAIDAELALIPVGRDNDYGHPRASLLTLLRTGGTRVARTDVDGTVAVWRQDDALRLWREGGVAHGH